MTEPIDQPDDLDVLRHAIAMCRICRDGPFEQARGPLPHEPRPVAVVSDKARILIAGQAPGLRVHQSGLPFDDASGNRLRDWLRVSRDEFYDPDRDPGRRTRRGSRAANRAGGSPTRRRREDRSDAPEVPAPARQSGCGPYPTPQPPAEARAVAGLALVRMVRLDRSGTWRWRAEGHPDHQAGR